MAQPIVGVAIAERSPRDTVARIKQAEQAGVAAAWLTTGGIGPDGLTILAAAAVETSRIRLGTSIVPTFPRHPLVVVQQTQVLASLAPGRFRLGLGPSHRNAIEGVFGIPFDRPLEHLREYATIVREMLQGGGVDFEGKRYQAHGRLSEAIDVSVLLSALRPASYELAGEIADGAISWITPAAFLRDVARPALESGARRRRDGARPVLVGHAFAAVSTDAAAVLQAGRERLAMYARAPFYQEMFALAGYPEARSGSLGDGAIRAVVLSGDDAAVRAGIQRFLDAGLDELIVSPLPVGSEPAASVTRTLGLLGSYNPA